MKIAFITAKYHVPDEELVRLSDEIKALKLTNFKIYFIDNRKNNKGYASAINQGIKMGMKDNCDLFVVINPDISFARDFGQKLLDSIDHFDIWGGAMSQDGKKYYGGVIDTRRASGGLITKKPKERFSEVDFVSGACMVISRKTIDKIGLIEESYLIYYEDVDYCVVAKKAGLKVGVDTELKYVHFETSKKTNLLKDWLLFKNRIKFLIKHGSVKQKIWEIFYIPKTLIEFTVLFFKPRIFLTNFTSMSVSSVVNRLLTFLLFINLVRLLTPGEYGQYALVWAHVAILMPILDLGTTTYSIVKLPQDTIDKFSEVFSLRVFLSAIVFISTITLALIFRYEINIIFYVILTCSAIFANSASGSFLIISSLKQKLYLPSLVSVLFQLFLVAGLILMLFISRNVGSLFVLICLLYIVYALVNLVLIRKIYGKNIVFKLNFHEWSNVISQSYVYVLIGIFAGMYYGADIFLLKFLKGTETVGIYSAGYRFFDAFMFLTASYSISATPRLSVLVKENSSEFVKKAKRDSILMFLLGFGVVICVLIFGPIFLPIILKGQYSTSIDVLRIIIFSLPLMLSTTVFINCLYLLNKQKWVIGLFALQVIFNVLANIILIPRFSLFASSYLTLLCEIINIIATSGMLLVLLKKDENKR